MNKFERGFNPDLPSDSKEIINEMEPKNIEGLESTADLETQEEDKEKEKEKKKKEEEERLYKEERERRVEIAKKEILQKKIDELFEELKGLLPEDLESLSNTGKTSGGEKFKSSSLGELNLKEATTLAKMIFNNEWVMDRILASLPELSEEWNTEIEEEATEKVDKQLKSEKESGDNPDKPAEEDVEENLDNSASSSESTPPVATAEENLEGAPENPAA